MDASDIDLLDKDRFAQGVPHEWFTWLRHNAPVYRHPEPDGPGFWVLSKHADITAANRNPALFSSDAENGGIVGLTEKERAPYKLMAKGAKSIPMMDPPEHTPYRAALERGFRPRRAAAMEALVRQVVVKVIEEAIARSGVVDVVEHVAGRITLGFLRDCSVPPRRTGPACTTWRTWPSVRTTRSMSSRSPESPRVRETSPGKCADQSVSSASAASVSCRCSGRQLRASAATIWRSTRGAVSCSVTRERLPKTVARARARTSSPSWCRPRSTASPCRFSRLCSTSNCC